MGKSSSFLRMIDVVFILLFGFIAVSQISSAEMIEPPKSTEAEESAPEGASVLIVGVRSDGTYSFENGTVLYANIWQVRSYIANELQDARKKKLKLGVRIRSAWDTPVEKSLAVANICRDLGIPKGIDVIRNTVD